MTLLRNLLLLAAVVVLTAACPGSEPTAVDACALTVAGTYDVVWTGAATNTADCPTPSPQVDFDSDGLDTGSSSLACSQSACTSATCARKTLDSTCAASMVVTGPCAGLADGRVLSTSTSFTSGKVAIEISDTLTTGGACAFTGVGSKG